MHDPAHAPAQSAPIATPLFVSQSGAGTWLHQITCPTLALAGAEDTAVPLAHAHMLAQGIPGAQLRIVDGAGHFLLWTHPDAVVHTTEAFLATGLNTVNHIFEPVSPDHGR